MSWPVIAIVKKDGTVIDVTQMCTTVSWAGNQDSIARTLDLGYVNAPYDPIIKNFPRPATGDYMLMYYPRGTEMFWGRVYSIEKTSEAGSVTVHCIDDAQYLIKSTANVVYKNKTAEWIAKKTCADAGVPAGSMAATGVNIADLKLDSSSLANIILKAYSMAYAQNGKKYMVTVQKRKVCVIEKGALIPDTLLSEDRTLTGSNYTESTEEIINRVVAYDSKGKVKKVVQDAASRAKYGTFSATYTEEEGVSVDAGAKALLHAPEQSLSVSSIGDIRFVTGKAVLLEDSATGMKGKYWIKSDRHHWENGAYTMDLELDFKNIMSTGS